MELGYGPNKIENNIFKGNQEAGVAIWETNNTAIINNQFEDKIFLRKMDRHEENNPGTPEYSLKNVRISGNTFRGGAVIEMKDHISKVFQKIAPSKLQESRETQSAYGISQMENNK